MYRVKDMEITVLYKDTDLAVCIKPAGIISEAGGMPELLSAQLGGEFFCVHRLDQAVGGVMVYARNPQAAARLSQLTAQRRMEKDYLALVPHVLPEEEGLMEDLLFRDREKNRSYVVKRMRRGVKEARLSYRTLAVIGNIALLQIRLHTGRSHQIRCQLSSRKAPILGDQRYGSRIPGDGIALWSYALSFPHPISGKTMQFRYPPREKIWSAYPELLSGLSSGASL